MRVERFCSSHNMVEKHAASHTGLVLCSQEEVISIISRDHEASHMAMVELLLSDWSSNDALKAETGCARLI